MVTGAGLAVNTPAAEIKKVISIKILIMTNPIPKAIYFAKGRFLTFVSNIFFTSYILVFITSSTPKLFKFIKQI